MGDGQGMDQAVQTRPSGSRPTIGLLTHNIQLTLWLGAVDAARERDVNLICVVGDELHVPDRSLAQRNVLYDLVDARSLDGIMIWGGGGAALGHYLDQEQMADFVKRYGSLPMVNYESPIEGIPTLLTDAYRGMRELIVHLIEVHGYRRIAFVRGPADHLETQERYRAYLDTLAEHGLPLDSDLVSPPTGWGMEQGLEMMEFLLAERRLQPGVDFDAVVAATAAHASGVLEALQRRGISVPDDVALATFDDTDEIRYATPPMTTVRKPLYRVGWRMVEMVLAMLEGEELPDEVVLPTELVMRQSCGCMASAVVRAGEQSAEDSSEMGGALAEEPSGLVLAAQREGIISAMVRAVGTASATNAPKWAEQLLDALVAELEGQPSGSFLRVLDRALRQVAAAGGDVAAWQGALSVLRRGALPFWDAGARTQCEDLWQQARVVVGEAMERAQASHALQVEQQARMVGEIGAALIATFDLAELLDMLARDLPRLGIPSCYVSLYENPQEPTEWSRLVLAYDEKGRVQLEPGGRRFPSCRLVPEGLLPQDRAYGMVMVPLCLPEAQLGFALFEIGLREAVVYETLRGQISGALQGARLVRQVQRRTLQLQTVAEVASATSSILAPDELVQRVVELVGERFDLYYAGLFLVDRTGEQAGGLGRWAVLRAGTGEAGRQMVARGHRLEVGGTSMIGSCISSQQARIALDVGREAVRFDNPLLPDTRSELALPLISRGEAIGALTIQSAQEAAFSEEDVAILQTMAGQVANAVENARLFEQTQAALEQMETTQRRYVLQAWEDRASMSEAVTSYSSASESTEAPEEAWLPAVSAALQQEGVIVEYDEQGGAMLGVPLAVQNEVIGMLGLGWEKTERRGEDEIAAIQAVAEQMALALENQRLFDEAQRATALMNERVQALDCLNDIGRWTEEAPPVPDFLRLVAGRVPAALRHSDVCVAAIEFEGQVYGTPEAIGLPRQMVQGLRVAGEVVGRVYIGYTEDHEFLDEESALLGDIARRVGGYIESQRLLEETRANAEEFAVLYELGRSLTGQLDLDQVLEEIYRGVSRLMDAANFYIGLYDPERHQIVFPLDVTGSVIDRRITILSADEGLTGYVLRTGESLLIEEDVVGWMRSKGIEAVGEAAQSWLGVPLLIGDQVQGVMAVQDYTTPRAFSESHRSRLVAVASQASVAIQNARLFEQIQLRARREQVLREITARVRSSSEPDMIVRTAVRELGTALGRRAFVRLGSVEELSAEGGE
jgi:GAF domain-containing protein/DNA-binding LacI/PurR family transcriptional regulator